MRNRQQCLRKLLLAGLIVTDDERRLAELAVAAHFKPGERRDRSRTPKPRGNLLKARPAVAVSKDGFAETFLDRLQLL